MRRPACVLLCASACVIVVALAGCGENAPEQAEQPHPGKESRRELAETAEPAPIDPTRAAELCAMPGQFDDPHPVLDGGSEALFWARPVAVDADGAANAYHRDDPHGARGLAIERMGYGMRIAKRGKLIPFRPNPDENQDWLDAYWRVVGNGWKAPRGWSVSIFGFAKDKNGNVCVRPDGRLVSATSLNLRRGEGPCDPRRYVDANEFSGIVVPSRSGDEDVVDGADPAIAPPFAARGVRRGDLAVVYHPRTRRWTGALIHDTGPRGKLGEGSIRLIMNLTGRTRAPETAAATNAMGVAEAYYLVFPGSGADLGDTEQLTPERVHESAAARFRQWGGVRRLLACAKRYKEPDGGAPAAVAQAPPLPPDTHEYADRFIAAHEPQPRAWPRVAYVALDPAVAFAAQVP